MLKEIANKLLPISIGTTLIGAPLYIVRCRNFSWCTSPIPFTLLEVLIIITIFFWFFNKLISKKSLSSSLKKIAPIFKILFLIFFLSSLVATFIAPDKYAALGAFKAYIFEPLVFAFICFDYMQEKNNKVIVLSLAFSAIWLGFLVFLEYIFHFSPVNQNEYLLRGRVGGVYTTSNAVALFLAPILFVVLGKIFDLSKKKEKLRDVVSLYLLTLSVFAATIGVLLSGSRAGIFGVFYGLVLFLVLKNTVEKNNERLLVIFQRIIKYVLPILIIFITLFLFNSRYFADLNSRNNIFPGINPRLCLWEGSTKLIASNPIFGSGLDGFQDVYKNYRTCSQEVLNYPHSVILNFWTEIGIFGLISFLGIIFLVSYKILKSNKISLTAVGIVCSFTAMFIHGLLDVPYFKNDLSLVFWVIVALAMYELDYQGFTVKHRSLRQSLRR